MRGSEGEREGGKEGGRDGMRKGGKERGQGLAGGGRREISALKMKYDEDDGVREVGSMTRRCTVFDSFEPSARR